MSKYDWLNLVSQSNYKIWFNRNTQRTFYVFMYATFPVQKHWKENLNLHFNHKAFGCKACILKIKLNIYVCMMYGYLLNMHEKKCSTLVKKFLLCLFACLPDKKEFYVTLFIRSKHLCFEYLPVFPTQKENTCILAYA